MRIDFIHDYTRALWDQGVAEKNATWLYRLFAPHLARAGQEARRLGSTHPSVRPLMRQPDGVGQWAHLYGSPSAAAHADTLIPVLRGAGLVVGFELSPNQMAALDAAGLFFVDVAIDPVRFAPDLFLSLRTSHPALASSLAAAAIPDAAIDPPDAHPAPAGAVLFVGQTDVDAALVEQGRLATIERFLPILQHRFGSGEQLLIKPHPYGIEHHAVRALHQACPSARIVKDNIYTLLSGGGVAEILTLSSGVAIEAPFFNVAATRLLTPDKDRLVQAFPAYRVTQQDAIKSLLDFAGIAPTAVAPTNLRESLGVSWAYPPSAVVPSRKVQEGASVIAKDVEPFCTFGWSSPEPEGCWTDGDWATLSIDPGTAMLDLHLRLHAFVPPGARPLAVTLTVRGEAFSRPLRFQAARPRTVIVPLPATSGPVEIVLHVENPRSPKSCGTSEDARRLGLQLSSIKLKPRAPYVNLDALRAMAASLVALIMS